jgi:hypothetical protein
MVDDERVGSFFVLGVIFTSPSVSLAVATATPPLFPHMQMASSLGACCDLALQPHAWVTAGAVFFVIFIRIS